MAWTRIVQTGFEGGTNLETNSLITVSVPGYNTYTGYKISGEYGYLATGNGQAAGHVFSNNVVQSRLSLLAVPSGPSYIGSLKMLDFFCPVGIEGMASFQVYAGRENYYSLRYLDPITHTYTTLDETELTGPGSHSGCCVAFGYTINTHALNPHVSFYRNGEKLLTYSGALLTSTSGVRAICVQRAVVFDSNSGINKIDDIYTDYSDGTEQDATPPTYRFGVKRSNGVGSTQEWSSSAGGTHHSDVDDVPFADSDYVHVATTGKKEYFAFSSFTLPSFHAISSVIPTARIKKGDAQKESTVKLLIRYPSEDLEDVSGDLALPIGYEYLHFRLESPLDYETWTPSILNACEFGVESSGAL